MNKMYSIEKGRGFNVFRKFDYILFFAVLILSITGLVVLRSATLVMPGEVNGDKLVIMQVVGMILGLILAIIISSIDYKDFKDVGVLMYLISIILLILVLFFGTGDKLNSKSWFNIAGFGSFQPSELAKITFIILTAVYFERLLDGHQERYLNIVKLAIISLSPILLILLQPDAGTTVVFIFSLIIMLFLVGLKFKYILITILFMVPTSILIWFFALGNYQKGRIISALNPDLDPQGAGYNVGKSKIAIGSGQINGKGIFQGIQTQHKGVPVKESDFIFSVIGEELGFIGAVLIILLVLFILLRCIYIAKNARDYHGSFLVIGFTAMFAFHYIENILMSMGLLPVTGIPMPFVSQGGTNMITSWISIGIILSVSNRRQRTIFNN